MLRHVSFTSRLAAGLIAPSVAILALAGTAHASDKDRAEAAMAAADAKIHTAEGLGASVAVPAATAEARAALAMAREDFDRGHRSDSIAEAIHASALADTAIGELQNRRNASAAAAHERERASVAAAQDEARASVAAAQDRAANAEQQATAAQQQAAEANARADAAQQAAASSAADAAAARDAAATLQTQPTQVETTVTTQHPTGVHRTTRTVRRTTHVAPVGGTATDQMTTTTTVPAH